MARLLAISRPLEKAPAGRRSPNTLINNKCWLEFYKAGGVIANLSERNGCRGPFRRQIKLCSLLKEKGYDSDPECEDFEDRVAGMGFDDLYLKEQLAVEEPGFDWTSAAIGGSVGFVAGYALMRVFRRKNDDQFSRV